MTGAANLQSLNVQIDIMGQGGTRAHHIQNQPLGGAEAFAVRCGLRAPTRGPRQEGNAVRRSPGVPPENIA
eukprot:457379-Pyramimonas_sp.AAC.2